jgi:hypothetical protein
MVDTAVRLRPGQARLASVDATVTMHLGTGLHLIAKSNSQPLIGYPTTYEDFHMKIFKYRARNTPASGPYLGTTVLSFNQ